MIFFKSKRTMDENHICSMCEYSKHLGDEWFCGNKKTDPAGYCRKFILDLRKVPAKRQSASTDDFEFPKID